MSVLEDFEEHEPALGVEDLQAEVVDDEQSALGDPGELTQVAAVCLAELQVLEELAGGQVDSTGSRRGRPAARGRRRGSSYLRRRDR